MKSGRELDAIVAVEIMGWGDPWSEPYYPTWKDSGIVMTEDCRVRPNVHAYRQLPTRLDECLAAFQKVPKYSTDMGAAWDVVERLRQQHDIGLIIKAYPHNRKHAYVATVPGSETAHATGDTAANVICRAALKVVKAA